MTSRSFATSVTEAQAGADRPPRFARGARASAPVRADLAGGTLDIWPLYCFMGGGVTVNAAVTLRAEATVRPLEARRGRVCLRVRSLDLDREETVTDFGAPGAFGFAVDAARAFEVDAAEITLQSPVPRGSGLGASSALLIALLGALRGLTGRKLAADDLVQLAADIEAKQIGIPTGKQDYFAALLGGPLGIAFQLGRPIATRIATPPAWLDDALALVFTGEPHDSAVTNWAMMRRYVEDEGTTRRDLRAIAATAEAVLAALSAGAPLDEVAPLVLEEWENRKRLAPGVTTPTVEAVVSAVRGAGAVAWKICGAGGGGALLALAPPGRREAVLDAAAAAGATPLRCALDREGLKVASLEA